MPTEKKIAILGLDNVGKTSLIRKILNLPSKEPPRTHGIDVTEAVLRKENKKIPVLFIDVGGLKVFQLTLWEELITSDISALIYVIDVN